MLRRALLLLFCSTAAAAEPPDYYARAEGLSGGPLKAALHEIVRGHSFIPYSQLHAPLARLHEDPANPANVLLLYSADSAPKGTDFASTDWNREHAWPRSRGNSDQLGPDDSDLHCIWPARDAVNTARGNLYFDASDRADPAFRSPAHPLAAATTLDSDSWEPPAGQRGALARALFYVAVRYDGDEPFTSDMELVSYVPSASQMGNLNTLLRWHAGEPVTDAERRRNDLIYSDYQRNRNPFVDHPEWVPLIWGEPLDGAAGSRPIARIDATVSSASEQPSYSGQFRISLAQAAPAGGIQIAVRLAGSAAAGTDYALSAVRSTAATFRYDPVLFRGTAIFAPGETTLLVVLTPLSDAIQEPPETATLILEPGLGYTIVPNTSRQATVTINDLPVLPALWRFDSGAPFADPLPADTGNALLSFAPWRGTIASFSGTSGNALALAGSDGNGTSILISLSMAGQRDLAVSFQTRGTASGFNTGHWAWSTDGATFTVLPEVNTASTSTTFSARAVDFAAVNALNNAPQVTLRYTLSGATSASGNNRIDDLSLTARPVSVQPDAAPQIIVQPVAATAASGTSLTLLVNAVGRPTPAYQWFKDGVPLPGATHTTLVLPAAGTGDAGQYHVLVTNALGSASSRTVPVTVVPSAARLINIAARANVTGGDATLIVGFVIAGAEPKPVLIRGAGPALTAFGVMPVVPDPMLVVYRDGRELGQNDDWSADDSAAHTAAGAFPFGARSLDAGLQLMLEPGSYTVQLSASPKTPARSGIGLIEVFEIGAGIPPASAARLVNLSTRAFVGAGQDILIPGVVIGPRGETNAWRLVLVRAIGPGLADFDVSGTLARPHLVVFDASGTAIAENIGWQGAPNRDGLIAATARVGAFPLNAGRADSALLLTLGPHPHTIQVSGADGGTGIALVEVYEVP